MLMFFENRSCADYVSFKTFRYIDFNGLCPPMTIFENFSIILYIYIYIYI